VRAAAPDGATAGRRRARNPERRTVDRKDENGTEAGKRRGANRTPVQSALTGAFPVAGADAEAGVVVVVSASDETGPLTKRA